MPIYWSILPFPLSWLSLWLQGAWSAKQNPGQTLVLPEPPSFSSTSAPPPVPVAEPGKAPGFFGGRSKRRLKKLKGTLKLGFRGGR